MPSLSSLWARENEARHIRLGTWPWGELREVYVDGERCTLYQIIITEFNCELFIQLRHRSDIAPGPGWHSIVTVG